MQINIIADKYNCIKCKYGITTDDYEHCGNCDKGSEFVKMSNADRIRSMSDAELADYLDNNFCHRYCCCERENQATLDWLRSEAE